MTFFDIHLPIDKMKFSPVHCIIKFIFLCNGNYLKSYYRWIVNNSYSFNLSLVSSPSTPLIAFHQICPYIEIFGVNFLFIEFVKGDFIKLKLRLGYFCEFTMICISWNPPTFFPIDSWGFSDHFRGIHLFLTLVLSQDISI